jgi:glycerophosphoryl diester phosphodiesterase
MTRRPQLVAHRGNAVDFPENTLAAFSSALQLGVRWLELDIQLSSDLVPIVIHDHTLERTTDQSGPVFDRSCDALCTISAGEPQRFGARFADERLATLADAVKLIRAVPDARLFVEIKSESLDHFGHRTVVEGVLKVLPRDGRQFIVIAFDDAAVELARQLGHLPIGWVLHKYDAASRQRCQALTPEFVFCNYTKFPKRAALWAGPWKWASYEVRDADVARALCSRGVSLIETMAVRDMSSALAGELLSGP